MRISSKKLLSACVFLSIVLHALALFLLQNHSHWLSISPRSAIVSPARKTQMLKESFQSLAIKNRKTALQPQKIAAQEKFSQAIPSPSPEIDTAALLVFQAPHPFRANELLAANEATPVLHPPPLKPPELFSSKIVIPTPPAPPIPLAKQQKAPSKLPEGPVRLAQVTPALPESPQTILIAYAAPEPADLPNLADDGSQRRALLTLPTPPLPSFPTLDELETSSYSDSFDIDLVCLPRPDQKGYIFALTLIPRADLKLPKMHQHYNFLIDRANSIQRERLLATKSAVLKAAGEIAPDDTFNIFVFDSKIEKLFPSARPADSAALKQAAEYLDKINLGSFFSPADLYNPLLLTLPATVQDDEIYTTIMFTDGENLAKKTGMRSILQTWTWQNNGKVALFTLGMGSDTQLAALDVASVFNKGRLYYSPTKRGIRRKLLKLMQNIHTPIAKNMVCRAIGKSQKKQIEIFPRPYQTMHLYLGQPFVILGISDTMDDFILFVQGRLKDRWLNIKKTISFTDAKKGDASLKQEWALQMAYQCYERYVADDNPQHLAEAQQLLQPYDIQTAFQ
jgi:hypothetical protein